ncbi:alpha/beta hydrolase [Nocardia panacis]|uniref:Alpha/beta hydrolase n=1 Tax=Nocardia panacis TaxID=2340916 RepID=A0A3A4JT03_9NOCA|nr:alpha/beta hydrolase [Nocardia panacis]RJO69049.1 alpha/beta hydrolase [Nocardia panacis]
MSAVRRWMFLVGAAVLVAGCSGTGTPSMPQPPAGLAKFYGQQVHWGSCDGFGERLPPTAQCARVAVPIDYAAPDGPTAQLALSRIKATGNRIGSLLINPGGPGESGLAMAALAGRTPVSEHFDRVGFDPRGVGSSTPAIVCQTAQENDADRAELPKDNSPAGIAAAEADNRRYADRCLTRSGKDFLAHVGTREVVQDMDVIRAVLGDPRLTYLGYSYGTRLGTAYAEKFPTRVRAMVLDGAIDPTQDPVAESLRQAAGFQTAFDAYAADCAQRGDCPLGTDPAAANARFRALVNPLWDKRIPTSDPRGLGYDDAITGVRQALYADELWPGLTLGLAELRDGRGDTLLRFADMYQARRDDGTYSNRIDSFNAIRCVDDPRVTDRAVVAEQDADARRVAPFADDGRGTGAAALELCATWPVPNTSAPHRVSIPDLPKLLVVSTTEDPATPYQAGVDLADQLGAGLLTFKGSRHTVALVAGESCVDRVVFDYLVDGKSPPADANC